jgi:acetylornithine deacetylase/succinyl-diaminopimelate desuccinylase-like protein
MVATIWLECMATTSTPPRHNHVPPDIDLPSLIHGQNERVPLSAVDFGAEAIYRLIQRY